MAQALYREVQLRDEMIDEVERNQHEMKNNYKLINQFWDNNFIQAKSGNFLGPKMADHNEGIVVSYLFKPFLVAPCYADPFGLSIADPVAVLNIKRGILRLSFFVVHEIISDLTPDGTDKKRQLDDLKNKVDQLFPLRSYSGDLRDDLRILILLNKQLITLYNMSASADGGGAGAEEDEDPQ